MHSYFFYKSDSDFEQLGHVRSSLLKSREENKKLSKSLEEVLNCNTSLKESINALMAELEKKIKSLKEIKKLRSVKLFHFIALVNVFVYISEIQLL